MSNTTLNTKLLGKQVLTELDSLIQFDTKTKLEQNYYLNSGDAAETIDYSDVINAKLIIFSSDNPFNIRIVEGGNTIDLPVTELFVYTPGDISGLTSIILTSLNATSHYIQVKFYGVAS